MHPNHVIETHTEFLLMIVVEIHTSHVIETYTPPLRMVPGPKAEAVTGPAAAVESSFVDTAPTTAADPEAVPVLVAGQ